MLTELWPSTLDTTAMSAPAARRSDAAPCRRSCSRTRRWPASFTSSRNRLDNAPGRSGLPSSRAKTQVVIGVRRAPLVPLHLLLHLVGQQDTDRAGVQLDAAGLAAGRLRWPNIHPPVRLPAVRAGVLAGQLQLDDLLPYDQHPGFKVNVFPPPPDRLTASQAATSSDRASNRVSVTRGPGTRPTRWVPTAQPSAVARRAARRSRPR